LGTSQTRQWAEGEPGGWSNQLWEKGGVAKTGQERTIAHGKTGECKNKRGAAGDVGLRINAVGGATQEAQGGIDIIRGEK